MKELKHILKNIEVLDKDISLANESMEVSSIVVDSREVKKNSLFVAIKGVDLDGHKYIKSAIKLGAKVIVYQEEIDLSDDSIILIKVSNTRKALGVIASNFYDNPSSKLKLIGVTGTNGKTTIATLLYKLFDGLGEKAGLFSTIKMIIDKEEIDAVNTTPSPIILNENLDKMVKAGVSYCFMEVSSHGIHQDRVSGLKFSAGVFTNITQDHLDYHKTFSEYIKVKKRFFDELPKTAFAVSNVDDRNGNVMLQNTLAKKITYSLKSISDYKIKLVESHFNGMLLSIDGQELWVNLTGEFNAYNILAIYTVAIELGMKKEEVLKKISTLNSVSGRFDYFISDTGVVVVVDYAHSEDALKNVLETINKIRIRAEKLITVVGCGGDRDKTKRPKMARVSCELSDKVIFTSDNPRTEDIATIIKEMEQGVSEEYYDKTISILDREEAIKLACQQAKPKDVILIAGKGHETYQEIMGVKHDFNDKKKAKVILKMLKK